MPAVKIYYKSGFVTGLPFKPNTIERYDEWCNGDSDASTYHTLPGIAFRNHLDPKKTIEIARKAVSLFGGVSLFGFINLNLIRNRFESDLHFKFLEDTVNYINTGVRSMSIEMWTQLLVVPNKSFTKHEAYKTTYSMKSDLYRKASIPQWLSHPDGLHDLILSLYIIFGKH